MAKIPFDDIHRVAAIWAKRLQSRVDAETVEECRRWAAEHPFHAKAFLYEAARLEVARLMTEESSSTEP